MKRRAVPFLVALGLIVLVIIGFLGVRLVDKYTPSKEPADIEKLLGVSGDEVAIFLNEEQQEAKGIYLENQTYLPLEWVNEKLNERFYWDNNEKLLVYTLPESIVYADHTTKGSTGKPLIWVNDEGVFLSLGLIANYTDIRLAVYDTAENKRIYVNNDWTEEKKAGIASKGNVRVKGGIKSPVITRVEKGSEVIVLDDTMEKWDKVRTADGYIGYVERRRLGEVRTETPISTFEAPVYTSISMDEPVCLAWHQVTRPDGNASFDKLIANTAGVNVIAPTWYELTDNEGGFHSYADAEYVKKAHDMGMQVWALINNFSSNVQTEVLMSKTSTRQKLIEKLMAEVEKYDLDGLNLDFEGIKKEAGVHYVQFIRELSVACRKNGTVLSVDNYVPTSGNQFYNRKEQGIVADYVIVMGYDEHYAGSSPGSVASIGYVEDGIANTLSQVPAEKVINAIPLYTRIWTTDSNGDVTSEALGMAKAKNWIEENNIELYWQEALGQYYGELKTDTATQEIWMEEERSIGLKMDLIKKYNLAGVACWKLGFEPKELWEIIRLDGE